MQKMILDFSRVSKRDAINWLWRCGRRCTPTEFIGRKCKLKNVMVVERNVLVAAASGKALKTYDI